MYLPDIIQFQTSTTTEFSHIEVEHLTRNQNPSLRPRIFEEEVITTESTLSPLQRIRNTLEPCRKRFRNEFVCLLRDSEFEYGYSSPAEEYVSAQLLKFGPFVREWINELFLEYFADPYILGSVLRVMSHFEYNSLYPQGITMCIAAVSHSEPVIKEEAVRVIENWENADMIPLLESLDVPEEWLGDYIHQVIADLEADR